MEGIYKVNLIPSDLGTEESVLQIADTLENLNGIVDDMFAKLSRRISRNMDTTNRLKERIELSRLKVDQLTGMQKAIRVFSSAKYPATITHEHYESVLNMDGYRHEPKKVVLSGKTQGQPSDKGIQEKLHFYHVKVAPPKTSKPRPDFDLHSVIRDMSTVGDLLVFNTAESPYLGTVSKTVAHVPKAPVTEDKSLLEAAPSTIVNRDVLRRDADEYMYAPGMGLVPELEMPLDLPHLPGVAGDVQFSIISDGSIAPSLVTSPVSHEPPTAPSKDHALITQTLTTNAESPKVDELEVNLPEVLPDVSLPEVPEMPDAPPPPPPPPMIPPPPPPPPMMAEAPVSSKGAHESKPGPGPVGSSGPSSSSGAPDAHSSLMAAIRQAGGAGRAKLRPAADAPADKPPKGATGGGGDLMADLHAKLSMRRRGISGAERGGTVLHALHRVIPEPGEATPQLSSSDDDWE